MSAKITPSVERAMQQILFDPATVEPGRSKVMAAWNAAGLDAEVLMSEAEEIAAIRAEALRTALLGADS